MNCLDCVSNGEDRAALAVCTQCGAAVCADHSMVRERTLTRLVGGGRTLSLAVRPPVRIIRCLPCDLAHLSG